MAASERPPVTVHYLGTSYPTPEQQHELITQLSSTPIAPPAPVARSVTDCADCLAHWDVNLTAACASVGIEHGKSTYQMIREYLAGYHERGHQEMS